MNSWQWLAPPPDTSQPKLRPIRGYGCDLVHNQGRGKAVKHNVGWSALVVALATISADLASAQTAPPPAAIAAEVPIAEIVTIARSLGLQPLRAPVRKGPIYTMRPH